MPDCQCIRPAELEQLNLKPVRVVALPGWDSESGSMSVGNPTRSHFESVALAIGVAGDSGVWVSAALAMDPTLTLTSHVASILPVAT